MSGIDFFRRLEQIKDRIEYAPHGEPPMGQEDLWWLVTQVERLMQPELPMFSTEQYETANAGSRRAALEMQVRINDEPFWGS